MTATLVRAVLEALADDPVAIAELRELLVDGQAPDVDPWFNVEEAAEYLRCKPQRIYDLRSQGRLVGGLDGTRVLFRRSTLDAYLEGRRR